MRPKIVEPNTARSWLGWATGTFAAIAWLAVAGKLVDMLDFIELLVRYWRDALRDLWTAFFSFLRLPYAFTPEQKDTLTALLACIGMAAQPYVWGGHSRPLFNVPMQTQRNNWRGGLADTSRLVGAASIISVFIVPFVDQDYYKGDIAMWGVIISLLAVLALVPIAVQIIINYWHQPKELWNAFQARLKRPDGTMTFGSAVAGGFKPVLWTLMPFLAVVVIWRNWSDLTTESYMQEFGAEHVVSLLLLVTLLGVLAFAVRKSLVPMLRVVAVGLTILVVGTSAETVKQVYARYFVSERASTAASEE